MDNLNNIQTEQGWSQQADKETQVVIPVIEEALHVERREVTTGRLRLTKTVHEHEELVDEPLIRVDVRVERIPVNQVVESAPPVRTEGDTTIISLVEEVLVLEKRLVVTEEVHVTKVKTEVHDPQTVTLRSEEITVERVPVRID